MLVKYGYLFQPNTTGLILLNYFLGFFNALDIADGVMPSWRTMLDNSGQNTF